MIDCYSQITENLPFLISHKMNFLYKKCIGTNIDIYKLNMESKIYILYIFKIYILY